MKKPSLIKFYGRLAGADLEVKSSQIVYELTDNPYFPAIQPEVAILKELHAAFSKALSDASTRDRSAIAIKDEAKTKLADYMRLLAINIESQCMGDRAKMISSGFDLASDGESVPALTAPEGFKVLEGLNPGEIITIVSGNRRSVAYSHEYCLAEPDESTIWTSITTSSRKHKFAGLPTGVRVYFRVAVIGHKKQIIYTNVLSRIVQ